MAPDGVAADAAFMDAPAAQASSSAATARYERFSKRLLPELLDE
jgi:hypothetical protein